MQFLKNHYEKIVLSLVLLGLAVAAGALPMRVSSEKENIESTVGGIVRTQPKPFEDYTDYRSTNQALVTRLKNPDKLELHQGHNVFNPVQWKKAADGRVFKIQNGNELGAGALIVSNISELRLTVSFEGLSGAADNPLYEISVIRETEPTPKQTRRVSRKTPKNNLFELISVEGPPDAPTELVIQLNGQKVQEPIHFSKEKPYSRVIGYSADLYYPIEKQNFPNRKVRDELDLKNDEKHKIVAITPEEVVLSAQSSQKRTIIKQRPASDLKSMNNLK